MHLWNDYEGKTVAGRWTLGSLLRTEGRSALFATTRNGEPAVLRLTEALNDQAVLRARFAAIQAAGDTYLVAIREFGDAEIDGAPLSFAVLEPTQESLTEILADRRLSPEETHEVATQVAGGLRALHAQGLVHGLVEPESILAANELIKLRSDCARSAPDPKDADLEGAITPRTDAVGLAGVIYRSLTQSRLQDASDALRLPEPFATIVRCTLRDSWGVPEISAELARPSRTARGAAVASAPSVPATVPVSARSPLPSPSPTSAPPAVAPLGRTEPVAATDTNASWRQPERVSEGRRVVILILVAAVVVLLLLFALFHHHGSTASAPASQAQPQQAQLTQPAAPVNTPAETPEPAPTPAPAGEVPAASAAPAKQGGRVWRVVAYTYNHKEQAQAKADWINRHFRGFHAAMWSRTGSKPFLVTLDGTMNQRQAQGLRDHARKVGVARDVYAQDYSE